MLPFKTVLRFRLPVVLSISAAMASAVGVACARAVPVSPSAVLASAVTGAPPSTGNFFDGARFYVNPDYVAKVEAAVGQFPTHAAQFRKVEAYPTAIWLDSVGAARETSRYLDAATAEQDATQKPTVVVFVLYDLPNRDCSAAASAGEMSVESGGEGRYQQDYINVIEKAFQAHPTVRIVGVIEPDSLANLATNVDKPNCKTSQAAYRDSIAYAIKVLSMPNVSLYLDAAHAGWLGWDRNRPVIAKIFSEVLTAAGGADRIRGFATDVSNYDVTTAPAGKAPKPGNPCVDELTYTQKLSEELAKVGITGKTFVIDTSRNGVDVATDNWCNVKGAGLGGRPKASPAPGIDAYYWIKPPGDSDGTSDPKADRFDRSCGLPSSAQNAPQAGTFFEPYFADLVANANPPL
jgi:cellulose 1,4-beta-cellobiosidase